MTNITRVIKDLIEANTYAEITANVGNTEPVTVDSIVYADQTWANTSNTSVTSAGGYIKLYGKGFETNANVFFGSTAATANVQSANEVRVNVPALATGTYTMFLYNPSGSNAIKYKSIPVQGDYNYGWFVGGIQAPSILSSVERIDFDNDTVNTDIRGSLVRETVFHSSSGTKDNLYIFGGAAVATATVGPATFLTSVQRITYANDEVTSLNRAPLSASTQRWRASTASKNYSYTAGGTSGTTLPTSAQHPANLSTAHRLDFSSDTETEASKANLSLSRMKLSSVSSDNYGWYIGGSSTSYWYSNTPAISQYTVTFFSLVDRLNFNSDTVTAVVRGPLNGERSFSGVTNNSDYAWIAAGIRESVMAQPSPGIHSSVHYWGTNVQRMTFSSDNLQMVVRVPSSTSIAQAGAGNENYGWFTGGFTAAGSPSVFQVSPNVAGIDVYAPVLSTTSRLTYASDTTAAASRSSLYQGRRHHTGDSGVVS